MMPSRCKLVQLQDEPKNYSTNLCMPCMACHISHELDPECPADFVFNQLTLMHGKIYAILLANGIVSAQQGCYFNYLVASACSPIDTAGCPCQSDIQNIQDCF